jgi:hypothetical protein
MRWQLQSLQQQQPQGQLQNQQQMQNELLQIQQQQMWATVNAARKRADMCAAMNVANAVVTPGDTSYTQTWYY